MTVGSPKLGSFDAADSVEATHRHLALLLALLALDVYHYLLLQQRLQQSQDGRAQSAHPHEHWVQILMAPEFEGLGEHEEPEEAQAEFQVEEPVLAPAFEKFGVGLLLGVDVGLGCFPLADQEDLVLLVFVALQVDRVDEYEGVGEDPEEGGEVLAVLVGAADALLDDLAADEDVEEPQGVVRDVVGDGAAVGEDGEDLEAQRLVGLEDLGEALDFVEEAEEAEDLAGGGNVLLEVVVDDHVLELLCVGRQLLRL